MKRCVVVLLTIFIFSNTLCSQTPSSTIVFDERVHDFGTILEKSGKVSHSFIYHNNGKSPANIDEIFSGCGCIGKAVSKVPVKPGRQGKITITFNPEYKSGFFSKEIVVYSNNGKNYNRIWVQGVITPAEHPVSDDYPYNFGEGLYLRLKVMAFGYLKPGETKQMQLHYTNNTNKEMTLNFAVKGNKDGLTFINPGKIGPKGKGIINFSYTMPVASKKIALFSLNPYVNNKQLNNTLDIKILNTSGLNQKK